MCTLELQCAFDPDPRVHTGSMRMTSMPSQCAGSGGDFDAHLPSIQFRKLFTFSIITRLLYANHGHESCTNQWQRKYTPFEQCSYQWQHRVGAQNRPRRYCGQLDDLVVYLRIRSLKSHNFYGEIYRYMIQDRHTYALPMST